MKILKKLSNDLIPLSRRQHFFLFLVIALAFQFIFFAIPSLADEINAQGVEASSTEDILIKNDSLSKSALTDATTSKIIEQNLETKAATTPAITVKKPEVKVEKVISTSVRTLTAYNSEVDQTDDSPCTTATGFNVCDHGQEDTIAANFLKFGTRIRIPELFGDRIFVVRDRMHPKNNQKVDVWMKSHADAMKFGVKVAKIEVLE